MTLLAAVGQSQALDGREAGLQAARQALNQLGNMPAALGVIAVSHQFEAQQVISGIASLTGNLPLVGFSTSECLTSGGLHRNSVTVALIGGGDIHADVHWLAGFSQGSREVIRELVGLLDQHPERPALFFADGFNTNVEQICAGLPPAAFVAGGLSCGDLRTGHAYQIGGNSSGSGGMALARLEGKVKMGIGFGHGWQPVGNAFQVTRSRGFWLRALDGRPASETYAHLFGYPARDWAFPPLNHLVRLYPLGVVQAAENLLIRSPIRVEADGSFRLNTPINDGSDAYLLVGSMEACRQAVEQAARQALNALEGIEPALALVLVDVAWRMLFEAQPGAEITAVQETLGKNVPVLGGYTLGQIVPGGGSNPPQFLNQHLLIVVLGEAR